jgi:SAM-dependent methyltransferase
MGPNGPSNRDSAVINPSSRDEACQVCGHVVFVHDDVLWPALIEAWELRPEEVDYINVQQGTRCERCGCNVRSQALARGLIHAVGAVGALEAVVASEASRDWRVLEINEAGTLTPWLRRLPQHVLASYPECDITRLVFPDASFDLVVHSDTLEHVSDPARGLQECRRVLAPGGSCVFTVPIVLGRLTRSRRGLPPSYHGHADCVEPDFLVHTEFGADVWTAVFDAGFERCDLVAFRYPAGLAIIAHGAHGADGAQR